MYGFGEKTFKSGTLGEITENNYRVLASTRDASRAWTGRIMTLSGVIIAFSVSIVSVKSFESNIEIEQLRLSWMYLLAALICGAFNLIFESRVAYASTWVNENIVVKKFPSVSIIDRLIAALLLLIIFFYPVYSPKNKAGFLAKPYLLVENWLYKLFGFVFIFEVATFILFIKGLYALISSF